MADTSPVPGALKRSEVLGERRHAERRVAERRAQPETDVSPTLKWFVVGFAGAALVFVSLGLILSAFLR